MGWLRVVESEQADIAVLQAFANEVKQRGFMMWPFGHGGSSLGPEVLSETFGQQSGAALPHAGQHRSGADQTLEKRSISPGRCSSSRPSGPVR